MDILYHGHTLEHWKNNAEEDYTKVPISVLKYITVLEEAVKDSFSKEKVIQTIKSCVTDIGEMDALTMKRINQWTANNL